MTLKGARTLVVRTLERELAITIERDDVAKLIVSFLGETMCPHATGSLPLDIATIVGPSPGYHLIFNNEPVVLNEPFPMRPSPYQLAFSSSHRLLRESFTRNENWFNFHGAAVRIADKALTIIAPSHSGKTTMALALVASGAMLYSDEFVFVRKSDLFVSGFPINPHLRTGAIAALGLPRLQTLLERALPPDGGHTAYDTFAADEIFGRDVAATLAPLGAVLILDAKAQVDRLEPVAAGVAAVAMSGALNNPKLGFQRLIEIARLIECVPTFRIRIENLNAAVSSIMKEFDK